MQIDVVNNENAKVGSLELRDDVFGGRVNTGLIWESVVHANAAERRGTHATKNRALVSGSGKKPWRQKGTGRARHGSKKAPIFKGGGKAFGPKPRDFAIDLPKKVRALALKHALSSKAKSEALVVIDKCELKDGKTKELKSRFAKLGFGSVLIIDGAGVQEAFARAARNLPAVDVLPVAGINVYDILRHDKLVLTTAAVEALEARFK